jgi:uncharacterized protein (TIGR03083 family)
MARPTFDGYLTHLRDESARFRAVLTDCDPEARVPGCPEWTAADLLWHLAGVQRFWATIISTRPAGPVEHDELARPATYDEMLTAYDGHRAALVAELEQADPAEVAWSWAPEQTVGFTFRRQAHEALIHRLDAEQTAGQVTALDPELAADGVDEALAVMFGGKPGWGSFSGLPHHVRVDITDTGESVWVQLGTFSGTDPESEKSYTDEPDLDVVVDPGTEADAVVTGSAAALDTWLWRRGDDADISVTGERDIYDRFRAAVNHPID